MPSIPSNIAFRDLLQFTPLSDKSQKMPELSNQTWINLFSYRDWETGVSGKLWQATNASASTRLKVGALVLQC